MGLLRDMFSKIGFCESTAALDEKPQWVEKLANKTLQSGLVPSDQSYKDRLEMALFQASNYSLSRRLEEDVLVCLDMRQSNLVSDFWGTDVYSIYYDDNNSRVLALYDNGKAEHGGFFTIGITDASGSAIDELVSDYLDRSKESSLMVGVKRYNAATKTSTFRYEHADAGDRLFRKNPDLLSAPAKPAGMAGYNHDEPR